MGAYGLTKKAKDSGVTLESVTRKELITKKDSNGKTVPSIGSDGKPRYRTVRDWEHLEWIPGEVPVNEIPEEWKDMYEAEANRSMLQSFLHEQKQIWPAWAVVIGVFSVYAVAAIL